MHITRFFNFINHQFWVDFYLLSLWNWCKVFSSI